MPRVFISYSRKDKVLAEKLNIALTDIQLESWVDWDNIPPTSDWWDQIQKGIESADAFVFLLSPDSAASKVCNLEIDHAIKNGKRLIPLLARDVQSDDVHPTLRKLNWIFFRESDDFSGALKKLNEGIRTDLEWVETHRRLQVRAVEWKKRGDRSLLLRGRDLREAEERLAGSGQKDPQPTDLQRQYILESRRSESRNRNVLLAIGVVVIVSLALLSGFAVNQSNLADNNAKTAVANADTAHTAQALAEKEQRIALSNGLSSNALLLQQRGEIGLAFLLSVQANNFIETPRSKNALYTLLKDNEYMVGIMELPDEASIETFPVYFTDSSGGYLLASLSWSSLDTEYSLWDLSTFQLVDTASLPPDTVISMDGETKTIIPNDSGIPLDNALAGDWEEPYTYLGALDGKLWKLYLLPEASLSLGTYCEFIKTMASKCAKPTMFVFKTDHPFFEPEDIVGPEAFILRMDLEFDQNGRLFLLAFGDGNLQVWEALDNRLKLAETIPSEGYLPREEWDRKTALEELLPDPGLVAWGTVDNEIIVWDMREKRVTAKYRFDSPIIDFEFSPDGTKLAVRDETGLRFFLRQESGLQHLELEIDPGPVTAMGFDYAGNIFVTGHDSQIQVFDFATGDPISVFGITASSDSGILNLKVSADGMNVAVGMFPFSVGPLESSYLVNLETAVETGPFFDAPSPVLSPDNTRMVTISPTHFGLYSWDFDIESLKARACQIAMRNLTLAEWSQYIGNELYQLTCPSLPAPQN